MRNANVPSAPNAAPPNRNALNSVDVRCAVAEFLRSVEQQEASRSEGDSKAVPKR